MDEILYLANTVDLQSFISYGAWALIPALFKYYAGKILKYKEDLDAKLENIAILEQRQNDATLKLDALIESHENQTCCQSTKIDDLIMSNERKANEYAKMSDELSKRITEQDEKIETIKKGGMIILGDRLHQSMSFFLEQGYTTEIAKMNIFRMYEEYEAHGGNSFISGMFEQYKELPVK